MIPMQRNPERKSLVPLGESLPGRAKVAVCSVFFFKITVP